MVHLDKYPPATISHLHGSPTTAAATLILFPDGAGSAPAYAALAAHLPPWILVYGLNCPFLKTPGEMTTIETMASIYVARIRDTLHTHPLGGRLVFGGWSAGGVLAYEALRQLGSKGDGEFSVAKLLLLDSPNPVGLQNPPARMYEFLSQIGIFGSRDSVPAWLFPHFEAFLRALDGYKPVALQEGAMAAAAPELLIVEARNGVIKEGQDGDGPRMEVRDDDPREVLWLLNKRTDFSASGWATLLGKSLQIRVVDKVNHFTMMSDSAALREIGQCW